MSNFTVSSKRNPCPICGRTKDGDCRISQDGSLVLCHHNFGDICPDGWRYVKPSADDRTGVFVRDYPKTDRPRNQTIKHEYRHFNRDGTVTAIRKYDAQGKKTYKAPAGVKSENLMPYRWHEVADSPEIFIVEGELDCDRLHEARLPAVSCRLWTDRHAELLRKKTAVIIPDCDEEGIKKATKTAKLLVKHEVTVKWCCLPRVGSWEHPKPKDGLGCYDFFQLGGTVAELKQAITDQPLFLLETQPANITANSLVTSEKEEKRAVADELIYLAIERPNITLWHTNDQDTYADILEGTVRQTLPIRDTSFRAWLRRQYFERHRKSPNDVAMAQAIATIESFALFDGGTNQVHLRTAEHNGRIYYDLGDTTWQAVEVSADGWRIVSDALVRFRRTKSMLPLPVPTAGGTLADLRQFMNLSDDAWAMVVSFAINCLRPCANYPILILHGEAGSGKSTLSTLLKNLVDPSKAMLMPSISDLRNLSISAYNRHLLVYDNLSGINNEQSDALCRIATGASFSHRKLQTDIEETTLDFVRPQILNGIDALATRGDLLDRSYLIQLSKPPEKADLKQYWADFERLHPQLLGALFTALSQAMANLPTVEIEDLPRMAEYAKLGTALEPSLGLPLGQFMVIHREVRQESHHTAIESSPIAQAIVKLMENRLIWKGYYKDLLAELNVLETNDLIKKSKAWASDAIRLSKALTRIAPDLRALGIDVITSDPITKLKYQDRQGKYLLIEKLLKISSPSSPSSHPAQDKGLRRDDNGDDTKNLSSPNNGEQPKNIAGDDKNDDGDDTKNLSSPLEPAQRKGGDDSDDGDDKNSPSSSKDGHEQRSLLQEDRPKLTNHYQIEDGDQDEF